MHKQRHIFILMLKCLSLHFQRCKTEITSGMSLEGLAAEFCLVETLKDTIESNILLFSKWSQKKLKTKYAQIHTHMCTQSHQQLVLPKFKIVSKSIPKQFDSTKYMNKCQITDPESLSPLAGRTTGNSALSFSLIYFILFTKTSVSAESDFSQTLFISLKVFSSYR